METLETEKKSLREMIAESGALTGIVTSNGYEGYKLIDREKLVGYLVENFSMDEVNKIIEELELHGVENEYFLTLGRIKHV